MTKRVAIIQGHPDPAGHHLLHALADAYAEGAIAAGHEVRCIEVASLESLLLRTLSRKIAPLTFNIAYNRVANPQFSTILHNSPQLSAS